jgi:hypothetical protein
MEGTVQAAPIIQGLLEVRAQQEYQVVHIQVQAVLPELLVEQHMLPKQIFQEVGLIIKQEQLHILKEQDYQDLDLELVTHHIAKAHRVESLMVKVQQEHLTARVPQVDIPDHIIQEPKVVYLEESQVVSQAESQAESQEAFREAFREVFQDR